MVEKRFFFFSEGRLEILTLDKSTQDLLIVSMRGFMKTVSLQSAGSDNTHLPSTILPDVIVLEMQQSIPS